MIDPQLNQLLEEIGVDLDFTPLPGGSYVPVNVRGNIAYVAIQFPIEKDGNRFIGRLGHELTTADGYKAARRCAINVLAQVNKFIGLNRIEGLNHIDLYYQCIAPWDEGLNVANGASDLFVKALGERGTHTRSLCGVHSLPRNFPVGITTSFTLL